MSTEEEDSLIESIMTAKKLTQEALCESIGYNKGYISQMRTRGKALHTKFIKMLQLTYADVIASYQPKDLETKTLNEPISKIIGTFEERLIKIESHQEVFGDLLAEILATDKHDVMNKSREIRASVDKVVNRRFDEFGKK